MIVFLVKVPLRKLQGLGQGLGGVGQGVGFFGGLGVQPTKI